MLYRDSWELGLLGTAGRTDNKLVTWFKDHGLCKSRINYSIAYPKVQYKMYCSQYMIAIVVLKPS